MFLENLNLLEYRAALKKKIRAYLDECGLVEADVPALYPFVCPDDAIDLISFQYCGRPFYLQPSPELNLKKLLTRYRRECYSLNYAYRADPRTPYHHPEFMILEFYLIGEQSYRRCIQKTLEIVFLFIGESGIRESSYIDLWSEILGSPYQRDIDYFQQILTRFGTDYHPQWDMNVLEDLIFSLHIQPTLGKSCVHVINGFPLHQAALAQVDAHSQTAYRYEVFVQGQEVANGYYELSDEQENRKRFESWAHRRVPHPQNPQNEFFDEAFFQAVSNLPPCSGVAIGIDRLFLCATGADKIEDVLLMPWSQYGF